MYIIIVGCGSLGSGLAKELSLIGHDIVIIDKEVSSFKTLGTGFNGVTILGTGIDEDVLKKAGVEQAEIFIAVTSTDSVNIMSAQVAKHIFKIKKVIARIFNPEMDHVYSELGIDTICPNTVAISHVKNSILADDIHIIKSIGYGDAVIIEAIIGSNLNGLTVEDIKIQHKFKVFAVVRNNETIIPQNDFQLIEGDLIHGIVRIDAVETIRDLLLSFER